MTEPTFKNSDDAFDDAIAAGRLSAHDTGPEYAGNWMYMGTWGGVDSFKNINSRQYLTDDLFLFAPEIVDAMECLPPEQKA